MHRAIFFDRDGVLNVNHGYVHRWEVFEWIEGAREAIQAANDQGILAVVVTNQSGIAQGMYDEATFHHLMDRVRQNLAEGGAHLDAVYFCPHHPDEGPCDCRKPKPGMILQAAREHDIDLSKSILIGDSDTDIEAASAAGVRSVLFTGGNVLKVLQEAGAYLP